MARASVVGILMTVVLVGCATPDVSSAMDAGSPENRLSGHVYDIDFLNRQGWTQILIKPNDGKALQTDSAFAQSVLETALSNAYPADVTYEPSANRGPPKIQTAAVSALPSGCSNKDCVKRVMCTSNGECSAQLYGKPYEVKTKDLRALGVLLTAMNKKKAVEYLDLDNNNYIVRVKINVPS